MSRTLAVGAADGSLTLLTGRQGLAGKAGHDLTLTVADWSGEATVDDTGALTSLDVTAKLSSLEVTKGEGGIKPLSDKDKVTILEQAAKTLQAAKHPLVTFTMTTATGTTDKPQVSGTATIAGESQPLKADLTVRRDNGQAQITATAEVIQSAFGIKPYTGMLGALKVRDLVEVRIEVTAALSN